MKGYPSKSSAISRRSFLRTAGGVTFAIALSPALAFTGNSRTGTLANGQLSAWVHLDGDGKITIYNPAAEMGQGSMTALAVILAEEMDAKWEDVTIEFSPIEPETYGLQWGGKLGGPMITVGSRTVKGYYQALRQAGAQVGWILRWNAAKMWNIPVENTSTGPGIVRKLSTGDTITYGELAKAGITRPDDIPEQKLKDPEHFQKIGKNLPRTDIPAKTNGTAIYSMDIHVPGMVYAIMERGLVHGASPKLINREQILKRPGVIDVVELDHGVAIVASSIETAFSSRGYLKIDWNLDHSAVGYNSIKAYEDYSARADNPEQGKTLEEKGNVQTAFQRAAQVVEAEYRNDFVYHAQMEPLNAVIAVAPDGKSAEVWVGSQAPDSARQQIAKSLGIGFEKVVFHPCYLGGGFGRRSMTDYVEEATLIAKQVMRPVKLIWTREDDLQYGAYRPISVQKLRVAVNAEGKIEGWEHHIVGTGDGLLASGAGIQYYDFPNQHMTLQSIDEKVRTKHWRSVGHGPNKYAIEAIIDETAHLLKADPVDLRLQYMQSDKRAAQVVKTVAQMAAWNEPVPTGRAKGIAFAERSGARTAAVVEISVNRDTGKISVHKCWMAMDAGVVVQPDNAIAQLEGGFLMGLSSVLYESITIEDGQVQQYNFDDYPLLRMEDTPEIMEVKLIPSTEKPEGVGEASTPVVGGAVANAFLALTGKALRHMPFTPEKVMSALNG